MDAKGSSPDGVYVDYRDLFALGTHGPVDASAALALLRTEIEHSAQRGDNCFEQTLEMLKSGCYEHFCLSTAAFREATRVYPLYRSNWHSGERLPLQHAGELGAESALLTCRGHYKVAYQKLREILELVALQLHFYIAQDYSLVRAWGRAEARTPSMRKMLDSIAGDQRCSEIAASFILKESITSLYDRLGAYVHTRGVPSTTMGLTGSNNILFSETALKRYCEFFEEVTHASILLLAAFFPAAVIPMDAFRKLGHFDPGWLPRDDHVMSIRRVLSPIEVSELESNASRNPWFLAVAKRLASLPYLSPEEIEQTYQQFQAAVREGPESIQALLKRTNALLEV